MCVCVREREREEKSRRASHGNVFIFIFLIENSINFLSTSLLVFRMGSQVVQSPCYTCVREVVYKSSSTMCMLRHLKQLDQRQQNNSIVHKYKRRWGGKGESEGGVVGRDRGGVKGRGERECDGRMIDIRTVEE